MVFKVFWKKMEKLIYVKCTKFLPNFTTQFSSSQFFIISLFHYIFTWQIYGSNKIKDVLMLILHNISNASGRSVGLR